MDLSKLLRADILLAPRCWHEFFLLKRNENPLLAFKLMTKEELITRSFFAIDENGIAYVMEHHNVTYELAKTYLDNLYFLPETLSEDIQIRHLQNLKKELNEGHLLKHDDLFLQFIRNKTMGIWGYNSDDSELHSVLSHWSVPYFFADKSPCGDLRQKKVFQFDTVEDELQWVFNRISSLLAKGTPIDEIFFVDPPDEYRFMLEKMSAFYGVPVNLGNDATLASSQPGIRFLSLILQGQNPETALDAMKTESPDSIETLLSETVQNLLPLTISKHRFHNFFLNKFRETPLERIEYAHAVRLIRGNFIPESGKIFWLGFNEGNFPKVQKNVDYLDDRKKLLLGRNVSVFENRVQEADLFALLSSSCELTISYKKQSLTDAFKPSPLIQQFHMDVVINPMAEEEYGRQWAKIRLGEYLDLQRKYQLRHPLLTSFQNQIPLNYQDYDHRFSGVVAIDPDAKSRYSYTSVSEFYECQFKYYLDHILNIDPFEDNFYTKFGKLAHSVLEKRYAEPFDFDRVFDEETKKQVFTTKEMVLLKRLKTEISNVILFNDEHEATMDAKEVFTERKISVPISKEITLTGIVDKIIMTGQKERYLSLVDYKTGSVDFNPALIRFGYSLQLPMYALLASRDTFLASHEVIGLYIQTIISKKLIRPTGKDAQTFYFDQFRLNGLFSDDLEKLKTFDGSFLDSKFIKSLKVTKNGVLSVAAQKKTISNDVLSGYMATTLEKIFQADASIKTNDFRINPKSFDHGELPCRYCSYRDICFRDETDIVHIKTKETEDAEVDA